ncbi:MAG: CPBP family intramembrane glutamic endopeptidase [Chloroflexota bacterium]
MNPDPPGDEPAIDNPTEPGGEAPPVPWRPGASLFTIEGRPAPALFVIAWLASLLGLAITVAGALGGSTLLFFFVGPGLLSLGFIAACGNQAFERRARGASYSGPSPFLVFGTIVAVSYFVGSIIGFGLDVFVGERTVAPPMAQLILGLLTAVIFVGIIRLTVVGTGGLSWAEMRIHAPDSRTLEDLGRGALLAVPVVLATAFVGGVLIAIFRVQPTSPLPPTGTVSGLLIQLLVGAVIAPVAEEIVFRGFAITAWERGIGPSRAILRSSLLFALAHVINVEGSSLPEAVGLIIVGAASRLPVAYALGWVFVRRRSIWASIGLHSAFNAILLLLGNLAINAAGG